MKIYTEKDVIDIVYSVVDNKKILISKSLYSYLNITEAQIIEIVNLINQQHNLSLEFNNYTTITINDIVEKMNEEISINKIVIRDFFLRICNENLDNYAVVFDSKKYTYNNLLKSVKKLTMGLNKLGVIKGSRVAVILSNRIEYIFIYFALFYIGAYPVPINTRWGKEEVFNILYDSSIELIIVEDKVGSIKYGEIIREHIKQNKKVKYVVYFDNNLYENKGIQYDLLSETKNHEMDLEEIYPDDVAMLSYTSGTTGVPKGVMLKQNDIVKISAYTTQLWRDEEEEYPLSIAPLYSAQGFLSLFINFAIGKTFKMMSSFNPNDILKEISKCENTVIHTQPTMWSLLLNCRIINFTKFTCIKKLVVSGSLCSPELAKRIEEKINCVLLNAYGLIESTSVVTMTRLDDPYEVRMNTVGRVIPGVQIKIVDEEHNEVPFGEVGELVVKGYNMKGYYNKPERTEDVLSKDGWLYTGDLAKYYDEENISIVGRCKDMIIRGGFNVYPSDIEEYILQIPGVQNVAVVGKSHEILGEEIVAFVLIKAGETLTKNDVFKFLFRKIANYKIPDKIYFVSEIPTILAGKIDKKELENWAIEGIPTDKQILFI